MNNFSISRINTNFGIFRLSGLYGSENLDSSILKIESIEVMGTDGWVLLNQSSDNVIKLIKELTPLSIAHLRANTS